MWYEVFFGKTKSFFAIPGGWPGYALEYVRDEGISNGLVYTYEEINGTCRRYLYPSIFSISDVCTYRLEGDEEKLQALLDEGPVVGAIGRNRKPSFSVIDLFCAIL